MSTVSDRIAALIAKQENRVSSPRADEYHNVSPVERDLRKVEDQLAMTVGLITGNDVRGALLSLVDVMAQLTEAVRDQNLAVEEAANAVQGLSEELTRTRS